MSANPTCLLLSTNGAASSRPALEYGIWLAGRLHTPVTLLGIVERAADHNQVDELLSEAKAKLQSAGIEFVSQIIKGDNRSVLCAQAQAGQHLTIIGPVDRPLVKRWIQGRSFRRIQKDIQTPLLYVKEPWEHLQHILLCMGGLGYATDAERWAIFLARQLEASLTILHVVEPISYDYPTAHAVQENWHAILATDTPQGENLRLGLLEAQDAGLNTQFKALHGDTVHEILAEVNDHDYDLVVMGSPNSSHSLRHLYMPNVTAEVAESVPCPVLTVEFGQHLIFEI